MGIEEVTDKDGHAVTKLEIAAHGRTAQIEIAVFHSYVVAPVGIVFDGKRRCDALAQHIEPAHDYLYVTCGYVLVLAFTLADSPNGLNTELTSEFVGTVAKLFVQSLVKNQLRDSITVAQVDKRHAAHLTAALDPSGKRNHAARIGETKLSTSL